MSENLLSGLRVIDLSHYIAGPHCTKIMAALGAEVIKIEKPNEGDGARRLGPFPGDRPDIEKSGLFLYLNTDKKSITLNLKTKTGVEIFEMLIGKADVLVENFAPRVMPGLGLSYDHLSKVNPKLVMTSISNFGQTGPYRDYKAQEVTTFALSGLMDLLGETDKPPLKLGGNPGQYVAGIMAFNGAMAALLEAEITGSGQHVDVSIAETLVSCNYQSLLEYIYTGNILKRLFRKLSLAPCKDGYVSFLVQQRQWPRLPELLGMPELLDDPRFQSRESRLLNAEALFSYIVSWLSERTKEEVYRAAQEVGIPSSYVATIADLFESPQLKFREYFVDIDHPVAGKFTYPGMPCRIVDDIPYHPKSAPLLGASNEEIYHHELGYSEEEITKLRQNGIV